MPGALKAYGIKEASWSDEEDMFALVHQMRTRIITSPRLTGAKAVSIFRRSVHELALAHRE